MDTQSYWTKDTWLMDLQDIVNLNTTQGFVGFNKTPSYNIDTTGYIKSDTGILTNAFTSSNASVKDITFSNLTGANASINSITFSNAIGSNATIGNIQTPYINLTTSNSLYCNGYSMYDPFPDDPDEGRWYFQTDKGNLHISWLRDELNILSDLFKLGTDIGSVVGFLYPFLKNVYDWWRPSGDFVEALSAGLQDWFGNAQANAIAEALQNALENGGDDYSGESNKFYVSWSNLKDKPFAVNNGLSVSMRGDLLLSDGYSIKSIPDGNLVRQGRNNLTQISSSGQETLINIGSKEAFLNYLLIGGSNSNFFFSRSNKSFKLQDWNFTCNSITNGSNQIAFSNNWFNYNGSISASNYIQAGVSFGGNQLTSFSNGDIQFNQSNFRIKYTLYNSNDTTQNTTSYLNMSPSNLEWKTQGSTACNGGTIAPQITQFAVDSNGVYLASNITTSNDLVIKSECPAEFLNGYGYNKTGILTMNDKALRFITRYTPIDLNATSNYDYVNFSVNSNGIFALTQPKLLGSTETIWRMIGLSNSNVEVSSFPRLEYSLSNGLVWGMELQNSNLVSDIFSVSRYGEISVRNPSTLLMEKIVDSNSALTRGSTSIDRFGVMRQSSNMIMTPDGTLSNQTISTCNLTCVTLQAVVINESNIYSQNTYTNFLSASNIQEGGSNLYNKYALSNDISTFSNWTTSNYFWTSNQLANNQSTSNLISIAGTGTAPHISYYDVPNSNAILRVLFTSSNPNGSFSNVGALSNVSLTKYATTTPSVSLLNTPYGGMVTTNSNNAGYYIMSGMGSCNSYTISCVVSGLDRVRQANGVSNNFNIPIVSSVHSTNQVLLGLQYVGGATQRWYMWNRSSAGGSFTTNMITGSTSSTLSNTYVLAVTMNSNGSSNYVNGTSSVSTQTGVKNSAPTYLFFSSNVYGAFPHPNIGDLRIYNTYLTSNQINNIYLSYTSNLDIPSTITTTYSNGLTTWNVNDNINNSLLSISSNATSVNMGTFTAPSITLGNMRMDSNGMYIGSNLIINFTNSNTPILSSFIDENMGLDEVIIGNQTFSSAYSNDPFQF
jgi:hypothetical protein